MDYRIVMIGPHGERDYVDHIFDGSDGAPKAVRAMNECGERGDQNGIWTLTASERAAVRAGATKAEEALQRLDVMALYQSMNKLKAMQMAERRAA